MGCDHFPKCKHVVASIFLSLHLVVPTSTLDHASFVCIFYPLSPCPLLLWIEHFVMLELVLDVTTLMLTLNPKKKKTKFHYITCMKKMDCLAYEIPNYNFKISRALFLTILHGVNNLGISNLKIKNQNVTLALFPMSFKKVEVRLINFLR